MRRACIDIGSNTTRLLVADCEAERLEPVYQERAFTHICRGRLEDGTITAVKIDEVASVVLAQMGRARELGAEHILGVATAAIRHAPNGLALTTAIHTACGLEVEILTEEREAGLAFAGAARTLGHVPEGELGVVDVGGASSELVVGTAPDRVSWSASFPLGSGSLTEEFLQSDPPSEAEISDVRRRLAQVLNGLDIPQPAEAVAVGGSASSLRQLAGPLLDGEAFTRALRLLTVAPAREVAHSVGIDIERVRLLPAALVILQAAAERYGAPLLIGLGGLREGALLEASGA